MANTLVNEPFGHTPAAHQRTMSGWVRTLLRTRREVLRISLHARRQRLQGYRHVPQRVWDRRSALFMERWRAKASADRRNRGASQ